jgi:hypothetical protein
MGPWPTILSTSPARTQRNRHGGQGRAEDDEQDQADQNGGETSLAARRRRALAPRGIRSGRRRVQRERLLGGLTQRLTVRADETLHEGPRRQRCEVVGLQRLQEARADPGGLGDLFQGDAVSLPELVQAISG